MDEKFGEYLIIILKEMCKRVGAKFKDVDFGSNRWYVDYQWTEEEQSDFKTWLADYLYKTREARQELTTIWNNTKKRCRDAASFFIFNYGWRTKE